MPTIDDIPNEVVEGEKYRGALKVHWEDSHWLTSTRWTILKAPEGMTIARAKLRWDDPVYQPEAHKIWVRATCDEESVDRLFDLFVNPFCPELEPVQTLEVQAETTNVSVQVSPKKPFRGEVEWTLVSRDSQSIEIDKKTGLVTWAKARFKSQASDRSRRVVDVKARYIPPLRGEPKEVTFEVVVLPNAPKIKQPADGKVWELDDFVDDLRETVAGSGPVVYSLVKFPVGAQVNDEGKVSWRAQRTEAKTKFEFEAKAAGPREEVKTKQWVVEVQSEAPVLEKPADAKLEPGKKYQPEIKLAKGIGNIDLTVDGLDPKMRLQYVGSALDRAELLWVAHAKGKAKHELNLTAEAKNYAGTDSVSWKVTVEDPKKKRKPPPEQQECGEEEQEKDPEPEEKQCCEPTMKVKCQHAAAQKSSKGKAKLDLRAGTHGWAGFHVSPFPGVNPRDYELVLPTKGQLPNEKVPGNKKDFVVGGKHRYPVLQVLAGYAQQPDLITVVIEHDTKKCKKPREYVALVGTSFRQNRLTLPKSKSQPAKPVKGKPGEFQFTAPADDQVLHRAGPLSMLADLYVLANLNPFRWPYLHSKQWQIVAFDLESGESVKNGGKLLAAQVEAYSDIRWEVNVSFSRSSPAKEGGKLDISGDPPRATGEIYKDDQGGFKAEQTESDSGWVLKGACKCTFDQYTLSLDTGIAKCLESAIPFLKTLDAAQTFLDGVSKLLPIGVSINMRMPALTVYIAAEPYEDTALVGYQYKIGFYAAPLIGIEIEWNLLLFILAVCPFTAPVVPILQALKTGIGVNGVAKLKVDVGIYLIAGGQIGVELEWAYQRPGGHNQYGMIDGRIDFNIQGRCEAELEVLIASAGAGVRVGAKTAIGLCLKATRDSGDTYLGVQGQTRWEGIVLYAIAYYKAGFKLGPINKSAQKTKSSTHALCKPHYWPSAPPKGKIGWKKNRPKASESGPEPDPPPSKDAKKKTGEDPTQHPPQRFDPFSPEPTNEGEEVTVDQDALDKEAGLHQKETKKAKKARKSRLRNAKPD